MYYSGGCITSFLYKFDYISETCKVPFIGQMTKFTGLYKSTYDARTLNDGDPRRW